MLMMHATQQHNGYSSHTQPQRPDSTALCMTDIGRSHPVENGKLNRNASGMQDHTSDRRSTSLPARKPSPQSPVDGLPNMTAFSVHGSASLPTAAAFLGETADILPDSAAASYSPRTKTCLYKVCHASCCCSGSCLASSVNGDCAYKSRTKS